MAIKRAKDLPFDMPEFVAYDIDRLVDEIESHGPLVDAAECEVKRSVRDLDPEAEQWCLDYYLRGGWKKDA